MRIIDLALKDLKRATRNFFLIGMAVAAPLLICALMYISFGRQLSGEATLAPVRVGVVNADALPDGAALEQSLGDAIRAMFADESVSTWLIPSDLDSPEAAQMALDAQEIGVAVVIPAGFTAGHLAGNPGDPVTVLQDPTLTVGPQAVRDMVTALLDGVASGGVAYVTLAGHVPAARLPALLPIYGEWYTGFQRSLLHGSADAALAVVPPGAAQGPAATPASVIMPLVMIGQIIFFAFYTGAYAMMSLLQEDEEGTLARLFTTATPRAAILAGKFVAVFLTVVLQGLVLLAAGRFLFQARWGQPLTVLLALVGQVCAATGLGVLLISLVRTTRQGGVVLGGALTALAMMSGLFTSNLTMPAGFQALAQFTPQGRTLALWRAAIEGSPPGEMLVPMLILVAIGAVLFSAGAMIFRRRYA